LNPVQANSGWSIQDVRHQIRVRGVKKGGAGLVPKSPNGWFAVVFSFRPSTNTPVFSLWRGYPIDKRFALRTRLVEPYRKIHRSSRSSRLITLLVCHKPTITAYLAQPTKHIKAAFFLQQGPDTEVPRRRPYPGRTGRGENVTCQNLPRSTSSTGGSASSLTSLN
jgi:hypothetical protein